MFLYGRFLNPKPRSRQDCEHRPYHWSLFCKDWTVTSGISADIGEIVTATWLYKNLFQEIPESLNKIATTLLDLKIHVDCLVAMVLQNRPALMVSLPLSTFNKFGCELRQLPDVIPTLLITTRT
jgi:hypothetical protein